MSVTKACPHATIAGLRFPIAFLAVNKHPNLRAAFRPTQEHFDDVLRLVGFRWPATHMGSPRSTRGHAAARRRSRGAGIGAELIVFPHERAARIQQSMRPSELEQSPRARGTRR